MSRRASQTAHVVAIARAVADAGGTTTVGFRDPVARSLLSWGWRVVYHLATLIQSVLPEATRPRALAWIDAMVLRTLAIDAAILDAVEGGCNQIGVLGAGLDDRAWRLAIPDIDVFEVDHPGTQAGKQTRVGDLAPMARRVTFVEMDFETDALTERLAAAGHRAQEPTVWVWEGVVMYLTDPALRRTLAAIRSASAPGSKLLVHYHEPGRRTRLLGLLLRVWSEPHIGLRSRESMSSMVEAAGFSVAEDTGTDAWKARFPTRRADVGVARVQRLLRASV